MPVRRRLLLLALPTAAVASLFACQPRITETSATTGASSSGATTGPGAGGAATATGASSSATTGGGVGGMGPGSGGGPGGAGGNDVTGTMVNEYVLESSTEMVPVDLSAVTVEALLFAGSWTAIPGHGKANGTFRIHDVPAGPYTLHVGSSYLATSERTLDLGTTVQGRPGAWPGPTSNRVIINEGLQPMVPWQTTDYAEWFVANSGGAQIGNFVGNLPNPGDTVLNAMVFWTPNPVITAAKGDTLTVIQLSTVASTPGAVVNTTRRFASIPGVTEVDPQATHVSGTFQDVPLDQTLAVSLQAAQFEAHGAEFNPGVVAPAANDVSLEIGTMPGAALHGYFGDAALLLGATPTSLVDTDLGVLHYGNPYPSSWGVVGTAYAYVHALLPVPGASQPFDAFGVVEVTADAATFGAGPIAPLVSPVLQPLVNGQTAFGPLQGITTTPTLSWSPPAIGAPTHYVVTVWPLVMMGGQVTFPFVASGVVQTSDTSVVIPPGIMAAGEMYYFDIQAALVPGEQPDHPYRQGLREATADAVSSVATP